MAVNPRTVTATAASNFGSYTLYLDLSENTYEGSNYSTVNWNAYLRKNASGDTSWNLNNTTRFYVEVNGIVSDFYGGYDFRSPNNFVGATRGMGSSTTGAIYHDVNGNAAINVRILMSGPGPITGGDSGNVTYTLTNFNRSAIQASPPSLSRSADGLVLYYSGTDPGAYNGGPDRDFDWNYRSAGGGWADLPNTADASGGSVSVGQHVTYYARMLAYNSDGSNGWSNESAPSYGIPNQPQTPSATRSTTIGQRIDLAWSAPSYVGAGITQYQIFRKKSTDANYPVTATATTTATSYADTGLERGVTYNYIIKAVNSTGVSPESSVVSAMAPGVPSQPGTPTITSKIGRNIVINSTRTSSDYGNAISGYRIQLSTDNGATWKGWDNSTKTFTAEGTYNTLDSSGNISYELLAPALTYLWRSYSINNIGSGDYAVTPTGTFVSSGGKRWTGTSWTPTETAKRWDGTQWVDLTIAKRWNGSAWVDLT